MHRPFKLENRLIDRLPVGVYTCALDGRITGYNAKAAELWGREPRLGDTDERFCGALRLFTPDGAPLAHDQIPMADCLRTGEAVENIRVVIERPDGSRVHVLVNIAPWYDDNGERVGAINVFHAYEERAERSRSNVVAFGT